MLHLLIAAAAAAEKREAALASAPNHAASIKLQNEWMLRSVAQTLNGTVLSAEAMIEQMQAAVKTVTPNPTSVTFRIGNSLSLPLKVWTKVLKQSVPSL